MFGPKRGVTSNVKGASVVPEEWNAVDLLLEPELR